MSIIINLLIINYPMCSQSCVPKPAADSIVCFPLLGSRLVIAMKLKDHTQNSRSVPESKDRESKDRLLVRQL